DHLRSELLDLLVASPLGGQLSQGNLRLLTFGRLLQKPLGRGPGVRLTAARRKEGCCSRRQQPGRRREHHRVTLLRPPTVTVCPPHTIDASQPASLQTLPAIAAMRPR